MSGFIEDDDMDTLAVEYRKTVRENERLREALWATGLHNLPGGVYADDWTEDVGVYVSPAALRKVVAALEEPKP